jgi:hypothetical protein
VDQYTLPTLSGPAWPAHEYSDFYGWGDLSNLRGAGNLLSDVVGQRGCDIGRCNCLRMVGRCFDHPARGPRLTHSEFTSPVLLARENVFYDRHFRGAGVRDIRGGWREFPRSKAVFQLKVGS